MYFLKRKTFTVFLLILSVVIGGYMMLSIPKEYYPEITVPVVVVQTSYPGASATEVEESVTDILEETLVGGLDDVDEISSTSQEGFSSIAIQFLDSIDTNEALIDVKDRVDQKKGELPEDANEPVVTKVNFTDQPIFTFALSSREAFNQLRQTAEDIEEELLTIPGLSSVDISGIPEREVTVLLDQDKLSAFGLNANSVVNAISRTENVLPVGYVVISNRTYRLDYTTDVLGVSDLNDIIVDARGEGGYVYVRDLVKNIEDGIREYDTQSRIVANTLDPELQQAIIFDVRKQEGGDITDMTNQIKERLASMSAENSGIDFVTVFDGGKEIQTNLSDLTRSGFQTILLVFLVMGLMVGFRESIIAALSVPMSFLLAFIGMQIFGQTINFITLFSLVLVIGILIDSAIVVVEGIYDFRKDGYSFYDAAAKTLQEFSKPIIAGVLTTISIFVPLMMISGVLGKFIGGIPRTINIVLVVSVAVALVFIPIIAALVYRLPSEPESWMVRRERVFAKMTAWYRNFLQKLLHNRKAKRRLIYVLIALFLSSFVLVGSGLIRSEFFPPDEVDRVYVNIELTEGDTLDATSQAVFDVEKRIVNLEHIEAFTTTIGSENVFVGPARSGKQFANIIINIDNKKNDGIVAASVREAVSDIDEYRVQVLQIESGPPVGAPFQVRVKGDNWDDINVAAQTVAVAIEGLVPSRDVDSGVDTGLTNIQIIAQRDRLAEYDMTAFDLSAILRTTIFGSEATSLELGTAGATDVMVKVAINDRSLSHRDSNKVSYDQIKNLPIQTNRGEVLLGYFIKPQITQATSKASHIDGDKVTTVTSYISDGFLPADLAEAFRSIEDNLVLPEGVTYAIAGATDENDQASAELISSLGFGILLIFGVLIWQFGSIRDVLFIISVIPLGLIGVLYGLFFFNMTLSFTAMLGFIALVGIVVNDSIILVDVMNKVRVRNPELSKYEVVLRGTSMRLRPVLLTTVTTVLGMIPLLFVSPIWEPFAFSVIFGLTFATVLTLVLVPIVYAKWSK